MERWTIRLLLTHGYCHDFTLLIPICEEGEKIYRDHSLRSSYHIVIPIYITQHFLCSILLDKFSHWGGHIILFLVFFSSWWQYHLTVPLCLYLGYSYVQGEVDNHLHCYMNSINYFSSNAKSIREYFSQYLGCFWY